MAKMSARELAAWLQGEQEAAKGRAAEETKAHKPETVTASIRVSGSCPRCGETNWANVTTSGTKGTTAIATSSASCGVSGCNGTVALSGSGVLK